MTGRDRHVDGSEPYGDEGASMEDLTGERPPDPTHVNGHAVEELPADDSHRFICRRCGGHADAMDDYRADECDEGIGR